MKISREVKISDDNYGNSTHRLELEVAVENLTEISSLLNTWEALLRKGAANFIMTDNMTVREARESEIARAEFESVVRRIAVLIQEPRHD